MTTNFFYFVYYFLLPQRIKIHQNLFSLQYVENVVKTKNFYLAQL